MYKLKRTWSHNDLNYIPGFKEKFPELKHLSSEELCDRFSELNVNFFEEIEVKEKLWIRITLPIALVLTVTMFLLIPIKYIITGSWYYQLRNTPFVYNWFKRFWLV